MYRNTVLISVVVCVVAVVAGLFIANLSTAGRPAAVPQRTPSAQSPAPAPTAAVLAAAPTTAMLATSAPTSAPAATAVPTSAPPPATAVPTAAPTSAPAPATEAPTSAPAPPTEAPTAAPTSVPPTAAPVAAQFVEYTVQRGDELLQLAKKYNVSAKDILANNQIENPDSLVVGQVLRIPVK